MDYLPNPKSLLITNISIQYLQKNGINEYFFSKKIFKIFMGKNTCIVGFNNISFDNILTRHLFYRNLFDPYEWSWKNGNSSWDILDVLRAFYIFFPNKILWPKNNKGFISFKLSDITKINKIKHNNIHDAYSDVLATILVSRLLKKVSENFFFFLYFSTRKNNLLQFLKKNEKKPFFYISSFFGSSFFNIGCVMFLMFHPNIKNSFFLIDLKKNLNVLLNLYYSQNLRINSIQELFQYGIILVSLNKSPIFLSYSFLSSKKCYNLKIDYLKCQRNFFLLLNNFSFLTWIRSLFSQKSFFNIKNITNNVDLMLYKNFFNFSDKNILLDFHGKKPLQWKDFYFKFKDFRIKNLIFNLLGRNFFCFLNANEKKIWKTHCLRKISNKRLKKYIRKIKILCFFYQKDKEKCHGLKKLILYVKSLKFLINNLI